MPDCIGSPPSKAGAVVVAMVLMILLHPPACVRTTPDATTTPTNIRNCVQRIRCGNGPKTPPMLVNNNTARKKNMAISYCKPVMVEKTMQIRQLAMSKQEISY